MSNDEWFVTMPKLGETVTEGELTNWLKQVGDKVEFDDPLFEVSTDKVDSEIPSPYDGVIAEILVQAGETVPIGTQLVRITSVAETPASPDNRLPSASHHLAAAGGPALGDPAAPQMGGSEGPSTRSRTSPHRPASSTTSPMPKLGETVTEGTIGSLAQEGRRHRRDGRRAVRGVDRQGRFGDPQPVRRGVARDPRRRRRNRPGRDPVGPDRRGRRHAPARRPRARRLRPRHRTPLRRALLRAASASRGRRAAGCVALAAGPPVGRRERFGRGGNLRHRGRRPDPSRGRREGVGQRRRQGCAAAPAPRSGGRSAAAAALHRHPRGPNRSRPAPTIRGTRPSPCPACGSRWPAA